tara:strand:- start:4126 stop:4575 length:450 start_codon:yes stop_codon:yes gene_type:complete
MALSDKNIVITPNIGQSADPQIVFSGADASTGAQNITVKVTPLSQGTLDISGSSGSIASFSDLSTGSVFSVTNDNGDVLFDVNETGTVNLSLSTGAFGLPSGTTAERPPSPQAGYERWNTDNNAKEIYDGTEWVEIIADYYPSGSTIFG